MAVSPTQYTHAFIIITFKDWTVAMSTETCMWNIETFITAGR